MSLWHWLFARNDNAGPSNESSTIPHAPEFSQRRAPPTSLQNVSTADRGTLPILIPQPEAAEQTKTGTLPEPGVKMNNKTHPTSGGESQGKVESQDQPAEPSTPSSLQEEPLRDNSAEEAFSMRPPDDLENDAHPEARHLADARSQALRNKWNQLAVLMDSFIGNLISAGDLRRDAVDKRHVVLENLSGFLNCSQDSTRSVFRQLEQSLVVLQGVEKQLHEIDETLIGQGDEFQTQASKIFGPVADASFEVLDQQGIAVPSSNVDTDDSTFMEDDIRLDRTSEALNYLSKKGDVDLLRESLMELDVERVLAAESQTLEEEDPDFLDSLESQKRELRQQLEMAENDLIQLHEKLPDRKVSIPEEQLRPLNEQGELVSDVSGSERASLHPEEQAPHQPQSRSRDSLLQILERVTNENPVRADTLVNAYLYYQLKSSPQEQLAYSRALQNAMQTTDQSAEPQTPTISLGRWFIEEARSKPSTSQARGILSLDSNASHPDQSHLTHGKSEPHLLPARFVTSDNVRRLEKFLGNQAADMHPQSTR